MTSTIAQKTGSALLWRSVHMLGDKTINLVRLLILASLLRPEDFGLLALAAIAVDIALRLTDTGMIQALVQRSDVNRTHYDVAWTVQLARSLLVAAVIGLAAPFIAEAFGDPRAAGLMQVLALRVALQGAANTGIADLHRELRFRTLALYHLTEVIVSTVATLALVSSIGVWALVVGPCIGATVQLAVSFVVARGPRRLSFDRASAGALLNFGQWIFLQGVVVVAGSSLLQLVIARQLGVYELGLYYLAMRLAMLPSNISSELAGAVAFPVYSKIRDEPGAAVRAMRTTLVCLAAVVLPGSLLLAAMAPGLVEHVLGERWSGTESLIVALAMVNIVGMIGDVLSPMFMALGRPIATTITAVILYSLLSLLALVLVPAFGVLGAAYCWIGAVTVTQAVGILLMYRLVGSLFIGTTTPLAVIAAISLAGAGTAATIAWMTPGLWGFVAAIGIGGGLIVAGLWSADNPFGLGLRSALGMAFPVMGRILARWER